MAEIKLEDWLPCSPLIGPPLPRFLGITWPWYKPPMIPPEELPPYAVQVGLKNPPSGAKKWFLIVQDWPNTTQRSARDLNVDEPAIIDVPSEWELPLRIIIQITTNGVLLYSVNSIGPDFAGYKEIFIPAYGSYYYNIATEQFEEV